MIELVSPLGHPRVEAQAARNPSARRSASGWGSSGTSTRRRAISGRGSSARSKRCASRRRSSARTRATPGCRSSAAASASSPRRSTTSSSASAPEGPAPAPPCATLLQPGRKGCPPWCWCTSLSRTLPARSARASARASRSSSSTSRTRPRWSRTRSRRTRRAAWPPSCCNSSAAEVLLHSAFGLRVVLRHSRRRNGRLCRTLCSGGRAGGIFGG